MADPKFCTCVMKKVKYTVLLLFTAALIYGQAEALSNPSSSSAAKTELAGHPSGVFVFFPQNSDTIRAWLTYEYSDPAGVKFDKEIFMEKRVSTNDYFFPALFDGSSKDCPYAPKLKKICLDRGSNAHSCYKGCITYGGSRPATPGSTNWKQCTHDSYRKRKLFGLRRTCEKEAGVQIVAYGEKGQIIVPLSVDRASYCAPAF